jgi:hypothetical protein
VLVKRRLKNLWVNCEEILQYEPGYPPRNKD